MDRSVLRERRVSHCKAYPGLRCTPSGLHAVLRARLVGIRVKQLLSIDLVIRDHLLPLGRNQPVDELLAERRPDIGCRAGLTSMTPYWLNSRWVPSPAM